MKIGYIGYKAAPMVLEHMKNVEVGISNECTAVVVEDVMQAVPDDILAINTSLPIKAFYLRKDVQKEFYEEFGIVRRTPQNFLYTFFNGKKFGDIIEIDYSLRFMSCNAGPALGFIQGAALGCDKGVFDAFPTLRKLEEALTQLEYRGEVVFGITKDFTICDLRFGHFTGGFALYSELCESSAQQLYNYCAGETTACNVHMDGISICTLLSLPPFPTQLKINTKINSASAAEKHLYRYYYTPEQEVAFVSVWGIHLAEARDRAYRIINSCRQHNPDVQYRADIGRRVSFIFNSERVKKFQTNPSFSDRRVAQVKE